MTRTLLLASACLAASLAAPIAFGQSGQSGQSYAADALSIEAFIGRVEIRTGSGTGISVRVEPGSGDHAGPAIREAAGRLVIDGGQSLRNLRCDSRRGELRIGRRPGAAEPISAYPTLIIEAPSTTSFHIEDSAFVGEAGDLGAARVAMDHCGDFSIRGIAGDAVLSINGSGDLTVGEIGGDAMLSINGSGDIGAAAVGNLDVSINGSGDIEIDRHSGAFGISINGSGTVLVASGMATSFNAGINGSGDITYRGEAAGVEITSNGSGDITLAAAGDVRAGLRGSGDIEIGTQTGHFEVSSRGSGDVRVANGRAMPFIVASSGSGDVRHGGEAVNTDVEIRGSGDVSAGAYSGSYRWVSRNGRVRTEPPAGGR